MPGGAEGKIVNGEERAVHFDLVGIDPETGAGHLKSLKEIDVEMGELDAAVETRAERIHYSGFQDGFCAVQAYFDGNEGGDYEKEKNRCDP
ncbi:hypothetical protein [Alloacidobacterium dinghuense]|uniref:hypothetical protein n=1 Tax=Alloacidobacterium dinghuense TaxID=2763107 RepID=UPI002037126B|nr:hypothetical protein [Alloacidobacterium dinghuense]